MVKYDTRYLNFIYCLLPRVDIDGNGNTNSNSNCGKEFINNEAENKENKLNSNSISLSKSISATIPNLQYEEITEYYFLNLIKYINLYQNESNENVKNLLIGMKHILNEVLCYDLNIRFYELLIVIIPMYQNTLTFLSTITMKNKLNKHVNSFINYKSDLFIDENLNEKKSANKNAEILRKFGFENKEFDYNKLILIKILNEFNSEKLNLDKEILDLLENSFEIEISLEKCSLISDLMYVLDIKLKDLENIYKFKFVQ